MVCLKNRNNLQSMENGLLLVLVRYLQLQVNRSDFLIYVNTLILKMNILRLSEYALHRKN